MDTENCQSLLVDLSPAEYVQVMLYAQALETSPSKALKSIIHGFFRYAEFIKGEGWLEEILSNKPERREAELIRALRD